MKSGEFAERPGGHSLRGHSKIKNFLKKHLTSIKKCCTITTVLLQIIQKGCEILLQLDLQSRVPIYEQLVNGVTKMTVLGALEAHAPLPSVRALAVELGINPNTVQKSYQMLEERGIIYSAAGKGSFVSPPGAALNAVISASRDKAGQVLREAAQMGLSRQEAEKLLNEIYNRIENSEGRSESK